MASDLRFHRLSPSAATLGAADAVVASAPWPTWLQQGQRLTGQQLVREGAGLQPLLHDAAYAVETAARARAQILLDAGASLLRAGTGGGP